MRLHGKDSGRTFRLNVREKLDVEVEENPTTGYRWEVTQLPDLLELKGREYVPDEPRRMGSGGLDTFHFVVAKAGSGSLKMELRRPWEREINPAGRFEVSLSSV
jgi:inhibitor of cysteine peptidase